MQKKEKLYKKQKDKEKADDLVPKEFELILDALNYLVKNKIVTLKSSEFVTINENEPIKLESDMMLKSNFFWHFVQNFILTKMI